MKSLSKIIRDILPGSAASRTDTGLRPPPAYNISRVIDVGVADGTPHLLLNYPSAFFYLVEASPRYHDRIETEILSEVEGCLIRSGAGEKVETLALSDRANASGFLPRTKKTREIEYHQVPVAPLDLLLEKEGFFDGSGNTFLKVDTEGYELFVLKGADRLLNDPSLTHVQVELRVNFVENTYNPSELFDLFSSYGFMFERIDHIEVRRGEVSYLDVTFARNGKR